MDRNSVIEMEYPFSFINVPKSLQSLAATEFALNLWRLKYFSKPSYQTDPGFSFLKEKFSTEDYVWLPSRIKNTIDGKIGLICWPLLQWINFHKKANLFDGTDFQIIFRKCFQSIVSSSNGQTISYKGTASNIIKGTQFSDVEKYKIASFFCLEEDIRRIWPSVSKNPRIVGDSVVKSDLMYHWNCRMKSRKDPVSALARFTKSYETKNWAAFEYFFDLLSHERKISKVVAIIGYNDDDATLRSLAMLNRDQAELVFKQRAREIFSIMISNYEYFWHIRCFLIEMKDAVFANPKTFFKILQKLFYEVFSGRQRYSNFSHCEQINLLLIEIWTLAPAKLKYHITDNHIGQFFNQLYAIPSGFSSFYGHDMMFMLDLFHNTNYKTRNDLWKKHWRKLVIRSKPSQLEEFIKSSLPNDQATEEFKRDVMLKFTWHFKLFIEQGLYSELNDYLLLCTTDSEVIHKLIKQALRSNAIVIISQDSSKLNKFETFIRGIFSNREKDIDKFKNQLISNQQSLDHLVRAFLKNPLENVTKVIDFFVSSDIDLMKLKRKILDRCRNHLTSYVIYCGMNYEKWQKMLEYCTDAEGISAFKRSLNIDDVLNHVFNYCRGYSKYFDQFAKWYFVDDNARKKFKSDKMFNYRNIPVLARVVGRGHGRQSEIHDLVRWCFENDPMKIAKFWMMFQLTKTLEL